MKKTMMLKKNYEFKKILTKGEYFTGQYLDFFIKNNNTSFNYLGIGVGVKIAKAVKRNKIKRLIRENYRLIEKELKTGYSIVILWKKRVDISNATFQNINQDIRNVFKRIGIL